MEQQDTNNLNPQSQSDEKTMLVLIHALGIILGIIGPLIIWLWKRDSSKLIDEQGKEAINFHISYYIYFFIAGLTWIILIGMVASIILSVAYIVLMIVAAVKVSEGKPHHFPLIFRFIK